MLLSAVLSGSRDSQPLITLPSVCMRSSIASSRGPEHDATRYMVASRSEHFLSRPTAETLIEISDVGRAAWVVESPLLVKLCTHTMHA